MIVTVFYFERLETKIEILFLKKTLSLRIGRGSVRELLSKMMLCQ